MKADEVRAFKSEEFVDSATGDDYCVQALAACHKNWVKQHTPESFWDSQEYFVMMLVEKIDLVTLFKPICELYRIPIANAKGWSDISCRAEMIRKCQYWEAQGKQCVLLYGGDFDPWGLKIARKLRDNLDELKCMQYDASQLIIDRFCLTHEFIVDHELTWIENLKTGGGKDLASTDHGQHSHHDVQEYISSYGARKVEANVLITIPGIARNMCREVVQKYIDTDAAEAYRERLDDHRDNCHKRFEAFFKKAAWRKIEAWL